MTRNTRQHPRSLVRRRSVRRPLRRVRATQTPLRGEPDLRAGPGAGGDALQRPGRHQPTHGDRGDFGPGGAPVLRGEDPVTF